MTISELISHLEEIERLHGDLEVIKDLNNDDCWPDAGYISITGQIYSKYDFDTFPEEYPEREEFDLKHDLICYL